MFTIKDVKIPKNATTKKTKKENSLTVYKAYKLKSGEEMTVNTKYDIFSFSIEKSIEQYINENVSIDAIDLLNSTTFCILAVKLDRDFLKNCPLINEDDEAVMTDGHISLSLANLKYAIDLGEYTVTDIHVEIDPKNEIKKITSIEGNYTLNLSYSHKN